MERAAWALWAAFYSLLCHASADPTRPNIVFIVADDLGWADVGHHGGEIPTPNIDALAYHGRILTRHYSQATCTPSRGAVMTGKYPFTYGLQGRPLGAGVAAGLPITEKIMPQYFKPLGYKTHLVGKWHLGYRRRGWLPTNRGFDNFYGFLNGYIGYYDGMHLTKTSTDPTGHKEEAYVGLDWRRNTQGAWGEISGKYLTDVITDESVRIISEHNSTEGLFLFVAQASPHSGNLPNLELDRPFSGLGERTKNFTVSQRRALADMIYKLDESVGKIINALKKSNLLDNSIIVFLSDNGAPTVDFLFNTENYGSNWPLRGIKMSLHDGGVRTGGVVWSPLLNITQKVYEPMFHLTDWLPTLYSAAGGNLSDLGNLDGVNHWENLNQNVPKEVRTTVIVDMDEVDKTEALIQGKWKLIKGRDGPNKFTDEYYGWDPMGLMEYNTTEITNSVTGQILFNYSSRIPPYMELRGKVEIRCNTKKHNVYPCIEYCLFDLSNDPCETTDLTNEYPEVHENLMKVLNENRKRLVNKPAIYYDPEANPVKFNNYWAPWLDEVSKANPLKTLMLYAPLISLLNFILARRL